MKKMMLLMALMVVVLGGSLSAAPVVSDSGYGIVQDYSTRFSTLNLDVGAFRMDRKLLNQKRDRLRSGTVIRYELSDGGERFPEGVISSIQIFEGAKTVCDVECE